MWRSSRKPLCLASGVASEQLVRSYGASGPQSGSGSIAIWRGMIRAAALCSASILHMRCVESCGPYMPSAFLQEYGHRLLPSDRRSPERSFPHAPSGAPDPSSSQPASPPEISLLGLRLWLWLAKAQPTQKGFLDSFRFTSSHLSPSQTHPHSHQMKRLLRGAQAAKQKVGVSQGTHDEAYDDLERELVRLQKTARELPKVIAGFSEGVRIMWKHYGKMTSELTKVTQSMELSPTCQQMVEKLETLGNECEQPLLDKLQDDLSSGAISVLKKLDADIKALEHVREERGKRRLDFDAVKEKTIKREAELTKKRKELDTDGTLKAWKIDVETAGKAYEVSNQRSIEEMTKVSSVKDDVFKMTAYNLSAFVGDYLEQAGKMMLGVKLIFELAQNGGAVFAKQDSSVPGGDALHSTPSSPVVAVSASNERCPSPVAEQQTQSPRLEATASAASLPVKDDTADAASVPSSPITPVKPEPPVSLGSHPPPLGETPTPVLATPAALANVPPPVSGVMAYAGAVGVDEQRMVFLIFFLGGKKQQALLSHGQERGHMNSIYYFWCVSSMCPVLRFPDSYLFKSLLLPFPSTATSPISSDKPSDPAALTREAAEHIDPTPTEETPVTPSTPVVEEAVPVPEVPEVASEVVAAATETAAAAVEEKQSEDSPPAAGEGEKAVEESS